MVKSAGCSVQGSTVLSDFFFVFVFLGGRGVVAMLDGSKHGGFDALKRKEQKLVDILSPLEDFTLQRHFYF